MEIRAAGWLAAIETELSKPKPRKPIVASEPQRIGAVASALVVTSAPGAPWSLKIATPRAWVFVHPFASGAACLEAGERRREAEVWQVARRIFLYWPITLTGEK